MPKLARAARGRAGGGGGGAGWLAWHDWSALVLPRLMAMSRLSPLPAGLGAASVSRPLPLLSVMADALVLAVVLPPAVLRGLDSATLAAGTVVQLSALLSIQVLPLQCAAPPGSCSAAPALPKALLSRSRWWPSTGVAAP